MDRLCDDDARALLGLPTAYVLPATEILVAEARRIVEINLALAHRRTVSGVGLAASPMAVSPMTVSPMTVSPMIVSPMTVSPIWERSAGRAAVRASTLPAPFASRYFTGGGRVVLGKSNVRTLVAELMPWMAQDPSGAFAALEDTLEVWTTEGAPLQALDSPYGGHYKLLSLMLADIARKADAGLDTLDWIASLGLPVEEFRDDDDPSEAEIQARMEARVDAMWAEEDAWLQAAMS
jgi:hypothetical protein